MKRAVRTVIRFVAAGIIIVSGMNAGLEYVRHQMQGVDISAWSIGFSVFGVVVGLVLFAISSSLANRMTDDFEE